MSKKDVQLNIRVTQELKDKIEESAKRNNRSINAEAITLMEEALSQKNKVIRDVSQDVDLQDFDMHEFASEMKKQLEQKQKEFNYFVDNFAKLLQEKKNK